MTGVRIVFYVLYIALGLIIVARMLSAGLRWEIFTGVIFGLLLIVLGAYRIASFLRSRTVNR